MNRFILVLCCLCAASPPASADTTTDMFEVLREQVQTLTATVADLTSTVQTQATRIRTLEGQQPSFAKAPASPTGPGGRLAAFNPEIGLVADMTGQLSQSREDGEGNDKLSVRELELVLGHDIDPYSRMDATITFSDFEDPT